HSAGQGSGIQSAFRQLGSALGIAVLTTTFFTTMGSRLHARLAESGMPNGRVDRFTDTVTDSAGAAIDSLASQPQTTAVADAARSAMTDGITVGGYVAAGFVVLGLVATLLIPRSPVPPDEAATSDPDTITV